ncbi:MAG: hypothetical protein RL753_299 [Bacteroidota bacterium]
MWHRVAQNLRGRYRLVMPDLRGYGDSSHAVGDAQHLHYSKRAMAQEVVGLLDAVRTDLCVEARNQKSGFGRRAAAK